MFDGAPTATTRPCVRPLALTTTPTYYCVCCHTPCSEQDLLVGAHANHDHLPLAEALAHGPSALLREARRTVELIEDHYHRPRRAQEEQARHATHALVEERARKVAQIAQLQKDIARLDGDIDEEKERAALAACHWHHHRQQLEKTLTRLDGGSRALSTLLERGDDSSARHVPQDEAMTVIDRFLQARTTNGQAVPATTRAGAKAPSDTPPVAVTVGRASAQRELQEVHDLVVMAREKLLADDPMAALLSVAGAGRASPPQHAQRLATETGGVCPSLPPHVATNATASASPRVHASDSVSTLLRAALLTLETTAAERQQAATRRAPSHTEDTEKGVPVHEAAVAAKVPDVAKHASLPTVAASEDAWETEASSSPPRTAPRPRSAASQAWEDALGAFLQSLTRSGPAASFESADAANEREGSSGACSSITQYQLNVMSQLREQTGRY